jgi:hypothetical protein
VITHLIYLKVIPPPCSLSIINLIELLFDILNCREPRLSPVDSGSERFLGEDALESGECDLVRQVEARLILSVERY